MVCSGGQIYEMSVHNKDFQYIWLAIGFSPIIDCIYNHQPLLMLHPYINMQNLLHVVLL